MKSLNEECTFILNYIKENIEGVAQLHIFSNGCGGQKKITFPILVNALVSLKKFKTVDQYFSIRGHFFFPCDWDFAVVKRKL